MILFALWLSSLFGCYQPSAPPSPQTTVDILLRLLHDRDPTVRRTAAEALGKIGHQQAVPGLVAVLGDESSLVREASVRSLKSVGSLDSATRAQIAELLGDGDPLVRTAAAQTLGSLEPTTEPWPLPMSQLSHADPELRRVAIQSLEGLASSAVVRVLAVALQDPDPQVRRAAVAVSAESGDRGLIGLLRRQLIEDTSSSVRAEIAYRQQYVSDTEAEEGLSIVAGHDASAQVRRWAEQSLRGLKGGPGSDSMPQPVPPVGPEPSHRYR